VKDLALLFPGQGAQYVGMGSAEAARSGAARDLLALAEEVLGYDLGRLIAEGPEEELRRTEHAQPAIFTVSMMSVRAAEESGDPALAAVGAASGLSLGEYTALCYAGVFSFEDGLRLVRARGVAMQAAADRTPSGMVSLVGADADTAEAVCGEARQDDVLVVANRNAPGQIVVAGDLAACARVPAVAKRLGIRRAIPLAVAGAFHSPLMEPARAVLAEALASLELRPPRIPVVSNVTAAPVRDAEEVRLLLGRQVVAPVLWEDGVRALAASGMRRFVELAPGRVLTGLLRKILPAAEGRALDGGDGRE
jgi:[acyl-carrier-protein] S-malonyltransferase